LHYASDKSYNEVNHVESHASACNSDAAIADVVRGLGPNGSYVLNNQAGVECYEDRKFIYNFNDSVFLWILRPVVDQIAQHVKWSHDLNRCHKHRVSLQKGYWEGEKQPPNQENHLKSDKAFRSESRVQRPVLARKFFRQKPWFVPCQKKVAQKRWKWGYDQNY